MITICEHDIYSKIITLFFDIGCVTQTYSCITPSMWNFVNNTEDKHGMPGEGGSCVINIFVKSVLARKGNQCRFIG